jgi:hypothetical protein
MNRLLTSILASGILACSAAAQDAKAAPQKDRLAVVPSCENVKVDITFAKGKYKVGEPITADVTLRNLGDEDCQVGPVLLYVSGALSGFFVHVKDAAGDELRPEAFSDLAIPWDLKKTPVESLLRRYWIRLPGGRFMGASIVLDFSIREKGKYQAQVRLWDDVMKLLTPDQIQALRETHERFLQGKYFSEIKTFSVE